MRCHFRTICCDLCVSIHFDLRYGNTTIHVYYIPGSIEDFTHLSYRLRMVILILTKFCILIICKSRTIHPAVLVTGDE